MLRIFPIIVAVFLAVLAVSGCGPAFVLDCAYRSITYDDVVYLKSNKTLYKRKSRDGVFGHPNLMKQDLGIFDISSRNDRIIIFGDYRTAIVKLNDMGLDFTLDQDSRPDIPYRTCLDRLGSYAPGEEPENMRGKLNKAQRRIAKREDAAEENIKDVKGANAASADAKKVAPEDIKITEDKNNEDNPLEAFGAPASDEEISEPKKDNPLTPSIGDKVQEAMSKNIKSAVPAPDFVDVKEESAPVPPPDILQGKDEGKADEKSLEPKVEKAEKPETIDTPVAKDAAAQPETEATPVDDNSEAARILKQLPAARSNTDNSVELKKQPTKTPLDAFKKFLPAE